MHPVAWGWVWWQMDSERGISGSKLSDNARAQPVFSYKAARH